MFARHCFVAGCNGNICKDGVTDDMTSGPCGQGCAPNATCRRSRAIVLDPCPDPLIATADSRLYWSRSEPDCFIRVCGLLIRVQPNAFSRFLCFPRNSDQTHGSKTHSVMRPCWFTLERSCCEGWSTFKGLKQEWIWNLEVKRSNSRSSRTF